MGANQRLMGGRPPQLTFEMLFVCFPGWHFLKTVSTLKLSTQQDFFFSILQVSIYMFEYTSTVPVFNTNMLYPEINTQMLSIFRV